MTKQLYNDGLKENLRSKIGIQGRIAFLVLLVVIITIVPISFIATIKYSNQNETEYNEHKMIMISRIGITFLEPAWDYDLVALNQLIQSEMLSKEIFSIRIHYKEKDLIWLSRSNDGRIESVKDIDRQEYLEEIDIPIKKNINATKIDQFANVVIWLDKRIKSKEIFTLIFDRSVEYLFMISIIILTVILATYIKLSKPLASIMRSIKNVSSNLQIGIFRNYQINTNKYAFKELHYMGKELNNMIFELEKSSDSLKKMNDILEEKVMERTNELSLSYEELKRTQNQLIFSEKMSILGQLVAGIAHEINTPLGSILSSNNSIDRNLKSIFDVIIFYSRLSDDEKDIFHILSSKLFLNDNFTQNSENREFKKAAVNFLDSHSVDNPEMNAEMLADIGFSELDGEIKKIMLHDNFQNIIQNIYPISSIYRSAKIINLAAEKAAKVVGALKTYSYYDKFEQKSFVKIEESMDVSLTLCLNKIKTGIEIIKHYENIPEIECYPDKLIQVWINIINNAVFAMEYKGQLEIKIKKTENYAVVSFTDNGKGISDDIKDKIFLPFFTTKNIGEGTGLGLDICRRIIEQIDGKIDFESVPGKTVFSVYLPLAV